MHEEIGRKSKMSSLRDLVKRDNVALKALAKTHYCYNMAQKSFKENNSTNTLRFLHNALYWFLISVLESSNICIPEDMVVSSFVKSATENIENIKDYINDKNLKDLEYIIYGSKQGIIPVDQWEDIPESVDSFIKVNTVEIALPLIGRLLDGNHYKV